MKDWKFVVGLFLIAVGGLGIISNVFNFHIFSMGNFWPLIVICIGIFFESVYFVSRKGIFLLVPGGILITIGLLFIFETFTNWYFAEYTWPIYPLAVAIGLLQVYIFGKKEPLLLLPIGILVAVTAVSFINMFIGNIFKIISFSIVVPIILVVVGIVVISDGLLRKNKK